KEVFYQLAYRKVNTGLDKKASGLKMTGCAPKENDVNYSQTLISTGNQAPSTFKAQSIGGNLEELPEVSATVTPAQDEAPAQTSKRLKFLRCHSLFHFPHFLEILAQPTPPRKNPAADSRSRRISQFKNL